MTQLTFTGRISGDMECFCWDDCDIDNKSRRNWHGVNGRLYPSDVWKKLGIEIDDNKKYRFTISVEEVKDDR